MLPRTPTSAVPPSAPPAYPSLAIHRGAIDQTTITNHPPPEAMRRVRAALESMGVIVQEESEYRYRCIRPRREPVAATKEDDDDLSFDPEGETTPFEDALVSATLIARVPSQSIQAQPTEAEITPTLLNSNPSFPETPLPHPTPSPPSISSPSPSQPHLPTPSPPPAPALHPTLSLSIPPPTSSATSSTSSIALLTVSAPSTPHAVAYGPPTADPGDEVRFSVELTRLDRLQGTYSLDIRRLRGNLRSYKFVYDSVRTRVSFAGAGAGAEVLVP